MIRRVTCNPVANLLFVIIAILGARHSSANAQAQLSASGTPRLIFSTYLGGSTPCESCNCTLTFAQNAAGDTQENTFVTGATTVSDLPVLNAWQPGPSSGSKISAFVAKYNSAGKLVWGTYLGGNQKSMGIGIAAMPDGGVAVAGLTSSDGSGPFPTMNAFQQQNNGQSDYFVTVFDASGNLRYSTYLGGSGPEGGPGTTDVFVDDGNCGNNVAVDANGLVYVTGVTPSAGGTGEIKFPVTSNALQADLKGGSDAFLCIIDPGKSGASSLVYSSFLGGDHGEQGHGVAVNATGGHITVAGYTRSSDFPTTTNAYRSHPAPSGYLSNGFVTQFTSSLPGDPSSQYTMRYSTYLGADSVDARDDCYGMTLDPKEVIVVTGRTQSAGFPMVGTSIPTIYNSAPYLKAGKSGDEPYLVKIDPSLDGNASLVYSTFLGGSSSDGTWGSFGSVVAVDSKGIAYVGGETSAPGKAYDSTVHQAPTRFPYTADALLPALQGSYDALLMQIGSDGAMLGYSTFFGGEKSDRAYGLAADPSGNIVISGLTFSSDFPLKNPAQKWPGNKDSQNAFVSKFAFSPPQNVPAVNSWGALLLFLALAGASLWKIRRKRRGRLG
jgi:large repetitive protein